ncbi:MAG: 2'-5' RNA ligase family protein [Clostridiales bacterium]|nr:2'-5' RNA ligase family protein [Clostridiales bacterium]
MSLRTIMIFPKFENIEIIDSIRKKYDPLADLVRPHITIVFPFESEMSNDELAAVLDERLKGIPAFDMELCGFGKQSEPFGNFLFLNLVKGAELIVKMHDLFYSNDFKNFFMDYPYMPHMTVGKLSTVEELEEAFEGVKTIEDSFVTRVRKISVEMIGEHEESIIILEKELLYDGEI